MQKSLKDLQADQVIQSVFTPAPFASFCIARNLRSHLVQFKLYHLQPINISYKFLHVRCQVGKNVKECYVGIYKCEIDNGEVLVPIG